MNGEADFLSDKTIMDYIWINYPQTREIREAAAFNKWNELFSGNTREDKKNNLDKLMNILNIFKKYTKGNEKLCTKLIKDIFFKIRQKHDVLIKNNQIEIINAFGKNKNDGDYEFYLENIKSEIEDEFLLEYEKLEKMTEIFDNTEIFSNLGWDLSKFKKEDIITLAYLENKIENEKEILLLVKKLGKRNKDEKKNEIHRKYSLETNNEIMGIKNGKDLNSLLPSELSLLHNPILKKYFYIKYNENRLLNYDLRGEEAKAINESMENGEGPIIICLDNSSSMKGKSELIAKSVVLHILREILKSKRKTYLISFSSGGNIEELELDGEEKSILSAVAFMKREFFGGTDFVDPIEKSMELIKSGKFKEADILFITDGLGNIPNNLIGKLIKEKSLFDFKIYALLINRDKSIPDFVDEAIFYRTNS